MKFLSIVTTSAFLVQFSSAFTVVDSKTSYFSSKGNIIQVSLRNQHLLYVASLHNVKTSTDAFHNKPSSIDNEISAQSHDPALDNNESFISEMQSILDDGHGHINKELATSIFLWENEHLGQGDSNPFPAAKLNYSTRDGLRLVDSIAREMERVDEKIEEGGRYNDLVQEGVISLMKSMFRWDHEGDFETYASKEIRKSMRRFLSESSDGVGVLKMNLDIMRKSVEEFDQQRQKKQRHEVIQISEPEPYGDIVKPLSQALLDENPTPEEIALSDMIRHDIDDFLDRTLDRVELKVIRARFGLEEVGTSLDEVAFELEKDISEIGKIEDAALQKLRISFSNDYIGAYLDDDQHSVEVTL
mmetsp:Transcript_10799/g.13662  ORF Transcript_10799/g.13662 Transcript_10799/m.13662 type:complete len:358 (-) Transcript_10799:171-1244(-)